jgi:hypothetical protein
MAVLGGAEVLHPRDLVGLGSDQRQQPAFDRALVQLHVVAEAEAADHVEQLLQRHPLGIEQQLVAGVEDPDVAEHLALGGEERRKAAPPGHERLDVVGHLTLQKLLGVGAGQCQFAPLGAVEQTAALGERQVLGVMDIERRHFTKDSERPDAPEIRSTRRPRMMF